MMQDKEVNIATFEGVTPFDTLNMVDFDWDTYNSASGFTSINDSMVGSIGTAATVSPKDIFNDPLASAPPSSAFTNLTSPSINESPYIGDSYDTSPTFGDGDLSANNWYSLFPEEDKPAATADSLQRTVSNQSFTQSSSSNSSPKPVVLDAASRRKSSTNSPAVLTQNAGVSKPRRRKGPLPPITVTDPSDKVALKRARNTLAARESRQRKYEHVQELEKRIAELEEEQKKASDEAEKWKNIALSLGYPQS
ncbi:Basic-leucine zipper (bZIP) transcription factor [Macrophomina phaseolina MS6]|uniref:Basic-leucine zipper (BZIP) transcription factor n=1 Tax=Macrophomina phaseolina (strain MS6) TaxID=1126212 RepID=K2RAI4_MACPH|nr:Basic-leucine zipper (bZIP) transcription factor [Macrophomina phaseolina MS6]